MLGVDKLDQLMSYFSFLHKSVKWWRKVFFWMVEVAVVNSYILYKQTMVQQGNRPLTHLGFRRELIKSLAEPLQLTVVPRQQSAPSLQRLQQVPHFLEKGSKRRDCWVCSNREEDGTRHLTMYFCTTCTDHPALCPAPCYKIYHTQRSYRQLV